MSYYYCPFCVEARHEEKERLAWVPPTDEERQMFMAAAYCYGNIEFDNWYVSDSQHFGAREIAESLAMDGL